MWAQPLRLRGDAALPSNYNGKHRKNAGVPMWRIVVPAGYGGTHAQPATPTLRDAH